MIKKEKNILKSVLFKQEKINYWFVKSISGTSEVQPSMGKYSIITSSIIVEVKDLINSPKA